MVYQLCMYITKLFYKICFYQHLASWIFKDSLLTFVLRVNNHEYQYNHSTLMTNLAIFSQKCHHCLYHFLLFISTYFKADHQQQFKGYASKLNTLKNFVMFRQNITVHRPKRPHKGILSFQYIIQQSVGSRQ